MLVISVRNTDVPTAIRVKRKRKDGTVIETAIRPSEYQSGIYDLRERKRDGELMFYLVGTIGRRLRSRKEAERRARKFCKRKHNREKYLYVDGVRQYTLLKSLPEDLATYLDFMKALEESKNEQSETNDEECQGDG